MGLIESHVESMNIRFEMGTLVLKGIELRLAGVAGQPRSRNNIVLRGIENDVVV